MNRRGFLVLAAGPAVALLLGGCTGVPSSSDPETVRTIELGAGSGQDPIAPVPDAKPRVLVSAFLSANAADPGNHSSARAFLTPAARNRWSDSSATIIDAESVGTFKPGKPVVVVHGRVVGTVSAAGIYTPSLQGTGDGGDAVPFEYGIKKVRGQYRIDRLRNGVVLTVEQFLSTYAQRNLYFFDLAQRYLVPDPRWTALNDPTELSNWLMTQLASGPRPELQNAVNSDTLPGQANARRLDVTVGTPTKVEIPGAGQLDEQARNRLAAQIGRTLYDTERGRTLVITDGGDPVQIPDAGRTEFTASGFSETAGPTPPSADVYYLRDGRIINAEDGTALVGAANSTAHLNSVALTRAGSPDSLSVAAVHGTGPNARLLVGTQGERLRETSVRGILSLPSWAPGRAETWIGNGPSIYRVTTSGRTIRVARVPVPSAAGGGRILALRLSPEGSRIAMAITSANGAQQLFVGSVVRAAGQVRVDTLQQISPQGVVITDLAWVESSKLYAIGYNAASQDAHIYDTGVDGSLWNARGIGSLPDPPTTLTVAVGQRGWVTAGGSVWVQSGSEWESPGSTGQTSGSDPVYLE